jgi:tetratricopeptide (TPR) repeat protein
MNRAGNTREAIKVLKSFLKLRPKDPEAEYQAHTNLGHLLMSLNDYGEAIKHFLRAFDLKGGDVDAMTNIGHCCSCLGDYKEALRTFKAAAAIRPDVLNLYNYGDAHLALDDPQSALVPLMKAVRKAPDYAPAQYDLSLALFELKKYREGAAAARDALRSDPEMKTQRINLGLGGTTNLGLCHLNLGEYEEALKCFKRNEQLFVGNLFNEGLALFRMKRFEEARKYFERALELEPDNAEFIDMLGLTHDSLGDPKKGEEFVRRALAIDKNYAVGHYDLGTILSVDPKRRQEAIKCYERSIALDPEGDWPYYALACIHNVGGNKAKALKYLKIAFEKGFRDKKHMDTDSDLDSLREKPEFKKLLGGFFSGKA